MFKLSEIKELIKLIDQTSVDELELEKEGSRLSIRKSKPQAAEAQARVIPVQTVPVAYAQGAAPAVPAQPVPQAAAPQTAEAAAAPAPQVAPGAEGGSGSSSWGDDRGLHKIVSPMVGTFYRSPSPDAPPFVNPGDKVNDKTVVCIVEAMKLMNEIEAEVKGEIVEVLVENGQLVEYGQPLFLVKTQ